MRARLDYTTKRGACVARFGDSAELANVLRLRAPIGATLTILEGPRSGEIIGRVEACDGSGDRCTDHCKRHFFYEIGDDVGI